MVIDARLCEFGLPITDEPCNYCGATWHENCGGFKMKKETLCTNCTHKIAYCSLLDVVRCELLEEPIRKYNEYAKICKDFDRKPHEEQTQTN